MKKFLPATAALVLSLLLAACGGGSAVITFTPTEPVPFVPQPVAPLATVSIASVLPSASAIANLVDGSQVAAWNDSTGLYAQRFTSAGLAGPRLQLAPAGSWLDGLAPLAGGGYVASYHQPGTAFVQVVDAYGQLAGPAATVLGASDIYGTHATNVQAATALAPMATGGFLAGADGYVSASRSGAYYDFYAKVFDAGGHTVTGPRLVSSGYIFSVPAVALPGGGFAFAYPVQDNETKIAFHDANLQPLTSVTSGSLYNTGPRLVTLSGGELVLLFNGGTTVNAQVWRWDPASSSATRIVDTVLLPNAQGLYHAYALPGSRLLVTWGGTHAQVFDASLQPTTVEFLIGSENVAPLRDGRIVSLLQLPGGLGAQYYDPAP